MAGGEAVLEPTALPAAGDPPPFCPSAQPGMEGAFAIGVVGGTLGERRVGYFPERVPVTDDLLALAGEIPATEVFRFAAPCAGDSCRHFDGSDCRLATKLVQLTPAVSSLPACTIRPECRWWKQEGKSACMRCPAVQTNCVARTDEARMAADPSVVI